MERKINVSVVKSGCFMSVLCLVLLLGITACSSEEFGTDLPGQKRTYTKQELIEQARSRLPQTRAGIGGVDMVTIKDSITIEFYTTEKVTVYWDDELKDTVVNSGKIVLNHKFSGQKPSYSVLLSCSKQALESLGLRHDGLISLEVSGNTNLESIDCISNHLDELNLDGCTKIYSLYIALNEFSSIDVSNLPDLSFLDVNSNRLKALDISNNPNLNVLCAGINRIKTLDLSNASLLTSLEVCENPIQELNLGKIIDLYSIDISSTQITELDISKYTKLAFIHLGNTPLKTLNNQPLQSTSFSIYPQLWRLEISNTSFPSLDLSNNLELHELIAEGASITQLTLPSDSKAELLLLSSSELETLICDEVPELRFLWIRNTPFEKSLSNIRFLNRLLPNRTGKIPGNLYTYSPYINFLTVANRNWVINPQ